MHSHIFTTYRYFVTSSYRYIYIYEYVPSTYMMPANIVPNLNSSRLPPKREWKSEPKITHQLSWRLLIMQGPRGHTVSVVYPRYRCLMPIRYQAISRPIMESAAYVCASTPHTPPQTSLHANCRYFVVIYSSLACRQQ